MKKRNKKYKSVITKRIWKAIEKIGVCLLILTFFVPVVMMRGTNSGFSDEEKSEGNNFSATNLDARASYVELFNVTGMIPGSQPDENMTFSNEGSLDFKYAIKYRNIGGSNDLCESLLLTAKRNTVTVYNKLLLKDFDLKSFGGTDFSIDTLGHDDWNFKLELPADAGKDLEEIICEFAFETDSWQTDFLDETQGFSDEEIIGMHRIETGGWINPGDVIINEIMWMGSDVHSLDEWIELKNMTSNPINIGGWKIEEAGSSGGTITIPSGKSIPANGYFLIANYGKTSSSSALDVDVDYVVNLSLGNTSNDNLILKTLANVVIDSAKGTPWPAGSNGAQKQSMERNDLPSDGLLNTSWHTCVSGAANGSPYWDATGNNYGTPGAANLSPVVINEIMFNPSGEYKEWVELYNISDKEIDVSGWYFINSNGDKVEISEENGDNNKNLSDDGETDVPSEGSLVVYFNKEYLDNEKDEISLYDDMGTPDDEKDDVREDAFKYKNADVFPEDKTFSRIPDGIGIWIDPEATPGRENKLDKKELNGFRLLAFNECFDKKGKLNKKSKEEICAPAFLEYLGMIDEVDSEKLDGDMKSKIVEMKDELEKEKLAEILKKTEEMIADSEPVADPLVTPKEAFPNSGEVGVNKPAGNEGVDLLPAEGLEEAEDTEIEAGTGEEESEDEEPEKPKEKGDNNSIDPNNEQEK